MSSYTAAQRKITEEITTTLTNVNSEDVDRLIAEINKAEKVFL